MEWLSNVYRQVFEINENINAPMLVDDELASILEFPSLLGAVKNSDGYKTYACCHHCYGQVKSVPYTYMVKGNCFRKEESYNEFRKSSFSMMEIVRFDDSMELEIYKNKLLYVWIKLMRKFSIEAFQIVIANDSFLTDNLELLLYQFLNKAKIELQVYSSKYKKYISISSINMHNNHFTKIFNIKNIRGGLSGSMCMGIGIGIERFYYIVKQKSMKA